MMMTASISPSSSYSLKVEQYIGACLIRQNREQQQSTTISNGPGMNSGSSHHLAQLVVHKQGAPLILTKNYRKQTVKWTTTARNAEQHQSFLTHFPHGEEADKKFLACNYDMHTMPYLPRIIKPRKRRKKKERTNSKSSSSSSSSQYSNSSLIVSYKKLPFVDCTKEMNNNSIRSDNVAETEKEENLLDSTTSTSCQCRYCNPLGQIWDVECLCYSPLLTVPSTTCTCFSNSSFTNNCDTIIEGLENDLSLLSLNDNSSTASGSNCNLQAFSRSNSSSLSISSNNSSCGDLEVSAEIVTSSLNGQRDLEIKFWLNNASPL